MDAHSLRILQLTAQPNEHALVCALLGEITRVRYRVDWAQNPEEGRQCIGRERYDACLIDSRIGSADGLEFIREMQAGGLAAGPMILLHDGDDRLLDEEAMKAGAADYLEKKSLSASSLDRALRFALQRRRILTTLKDQAARLREQAALLDQVNDAIVVRDLNHRYLYCNPAAARIAGTTVEAALGNTIYTVMSEVSPQYDEAVRRVLRDGHWEGELTHKRRDGHPFTVEARWTLLRDDAGEARAIFAISADISEKKRLEAQYLRAQRMESIGLLAGGIAHDLNNVLSPVIMATQLLKLKHHDEESQRLLDTIVTSARRGAGLVQQVLSFSRGIESKSVLVEARSLVRDVEMLIAETVDKAIEVTIDLEAGLWPVIGDPTQLHQVLMNLCVNARDAMPRGGRLSIAARNLAVDAPFAVMSQRLRPGRYVLFEVEDTGTGIPPDIQEHLFEAFFTTKEPGKGTGLGLSTVRTIVTGHHGHVTFDTKSGQGTRFRVYLPASSDAPLLRDSGPAEPVPVGHGETILVVDDEVQLLDLIRRALSIRGYQVLTAVNGAEALALYVQNHQRIALVMTDLVMPVLDGMSFIEALKKVSSTARVMVISGIKSPEDFAGTGIAAFLPKPFTTEKMLRVICQVLAVTQPASEEASAGPADSRSPVPAVVPALT